jgi:hypothetical protein
MLKHRFDRDRSDVGEIADAVALRGREVLGAAVAKPGENECSLYDYSKIRVV